jgi:tetratricopeptide (TPR) repeat protein
MKLVAKRTKLYATALSAVALAASVLSCSTEKTARLGAGVAALRGMVYNEERMPVQDAEVACVFGGSIEKSAKTDIHGRYLIPNLSYGPIRLRFEKEGYEALDWSFAFDDPAQVAYAKMSNLDELLDDAAEAIEKGDWNSASSFLIRAKKLDAGSVVAIYLEARMASRKCDFEGAAAMLERLSAGESPFFAVELSLADLYQYKLGRPEEALRHLKRALAIRGDSEVEDRIAALGKE